jgi:integrase
MVLQMARPSARAGTLNHQYRRRYPTDIRRILDGLGSSFTRPSGWGREGITLTLGTASGTQAKAAHARIAADVEAIFATLRAGPRSLSHKETVALSGEVYRALIAEHEDNPGEVERWVRAEVENLRAESGQHDPSSLRIETEVERKLRGFERLFGARVDALLSSKALWVEEESRGRLLEQVSAAVRQGNLVLMERAAGDYSPDPLAHRFPEVPALTATTLRGRGKLTMAALFERWEKHPEQQNTSPDTKRRYKGVFAAVSKFLGNPDAREVSSADLQRYVEARMEAAENPLSPRAARDVHKAALSSVYGWATTKATLTGIKANPAAGVGIKVVKARATRQKGLTDAEAHRLVDAALAVQAVEAQPRTLHAARRWATLVCFYTGSRIGAVAQLRSEDVSVHPDGAMIRFTPEAGEGIKGDARVVPVHPRLVELGFLAFVKAAPLGPLFYNPSQRRRANARIPQGDLVARELAEWAGTVVAAPDLGKVLHAIRHRFMTCCRHAGIEEQYVEAIAGHAPGRQNRQYGEFPVAALARELLRLDPMRVEGSLA